MDKEVRLTKREKELIEFILKGWSNREIAQKLYLAEGTVKNQVSHLLKKLKLKRRTQLYDCYDELCEKP